MTFWQSQEILESIPLFWDLVNGENSTGEKLEKKKVTTKNEAKNLGIPVYDKRPG